MIAKRIVGWILIIAVIILLLFLFGNLFYRLVSNFTFPHR